MKTKQLLCTSILSLLCFAGQARAEVTQKLTVDGDIAKQLFKTLLKSGIQPTVMPGASKIDIHQLACSDGFDMRTHSLITQCSFNQYITGTSGSNEVVEKNYVLNNEDGKELITALQDSGLKGHNVIETTLYNASRIHCSKWVLSPEYKNTTHCTIEWI
jgi:hypothetical protein